MLVLSVSGHHLEVASEELDEIVKLTHAIAQFGLPVNPVGVVRVSLIFVRDHLTDASESITLSGTRLQESERAGQSELFDAGNSEETR